jgi:hypothetical protein
VVFDLNGLGRVGYLVRYVPAVHADPSDRPILVAGAATLQIMIGAPDFRESGHQAWRTPWQLGQRLAGGGTTLREVRLRLADLWPCPMPGWISRTGVAGSNSAVSR